LNFRTVCVLKAHKGLYDFWKEVVGGPKLSSGINPKLALAISVLVSVALREPLLGPE
jgi:hypothetical protein